MGFRGAWVKNRRALLAAGGAIGGAALLGTSVAMAAASPLNEGPTERTFVAVKPDGVQRGLVGEVIGRFERKGYKLVALKVVVPSPAFAQRHYADLREKPFFPGLVDYFSSGPVVAMVFEGPSVVRGGRALVGATNPVDAAPGSLRGDLCLDVSRNIVHASDSPASADREIALWFSPSDLANYSLANAHWISEPAKPAPRAAAETSAGFFQKIASIFGL